MLDAAGANATSPCHRVATLVGLVSSVMSKKKGHAAAAPLPDLTTTREVINALKQLYMERIRPIEVAYNFAEVRISLACVRMCGLPSCPSALGIVSYLG